jgi:sugar phosphate isomerase/epimerase
MRHGLDHSENQEARIQRVREIMSLSFDLGPRRVIVEAGRMPDDEKDPRYRVLVESLEALGRHGDRVGAVVALETGLEPGSSLAQLLTRFGSGALGVNFDPANLLMNGFDIYESLNALAGRIVHSHAHDARQADGNRAAREVPVGHGDIDWLRYLSELEHHGFNGWIVVEQESGDHRRQDISAGVDFLKRLVSGE